MTSLIEKVARVVCFNSEYRDNHPDGPDDLTCLVCKSPAECQDWNVYSLGNERIALAAIQVVLREMMEFERDFDLAGLTHVFAKHHNIDLT